MILLIDNYDSFSYNLCQMVGELEPDLTVIRNDEMTVEQIRALNPARILLSPGPGRPEAAGVLMDVVRTLGREIPMLGVCLGHQAICAAFGATITYARKLMHGKQSMVTLDPDCPLFRGCPAVVPVARYHSPGRRPGHPARLPAHHRRHRRRRGDGGTAPAVSHLRGAVPPRVHPDPGRGNHAEKFYLL